jgi:hypothetical protein
MKVAEDVEYAERPHRARFIPSLIDDGRHAEPAAWPRARARQVEPTAVYSEKGVRRAQKMQVGP